MTSARNKKPRPTAGRPKIILPGAPGIIQPLTPHETRMDELGAIFSPPPWQAGADEVYAKLRWAAERDIGSRLEARKCWDRACQIIPATQFGGSGLQMASLLRSYFVEFADRMVRHGPHSLPAAFNIVEAFLQYDPSTSLFLIRPEKEHLLSLSEYLNWYAQEEVPRDPSILLDVIEDSIIYSYDFASAPYDYQIAGSESRFTIAAAAFVRHGTELSCIFLTGESPPRDPDEQLNSIELDSGSIPPGKDGIQPHSDWKVRDRYLESSPDFARVIFLTRLDVRSCRYDVRHIALDIGPSYLVITDDTTAWEGLPPDCVPDLGTLTESFGRYDSLMSACSSLIYLPIAYVAMPERTQNQTFCTSLASKENEKLVQTASRFLSSDQLQLVRSVCCMQSIISNPTHPEWTITPPNLEFQVEGFWKQLPPGAVGEDAEGNNVVGRTWVTRHESWAATSVGAFLVKRDARKPVGPDPGVIYIVRCAGHEPDVYKIGLTRRDANTRAHELGRATGVPLPFAVLASWEVGDCRRIESECHSRLAAYRLNPKREFFGGRLQNLVLAINEVVSECECK